MALVLALSLSGSVSKLSVIVAAAALLGVAILTLLFFAQAREVKRLREWGGEVSDRIAQLAQEHAAAARRAAQAAPNEAQRMPQTAPARPQGVVPRAVPLVARSQAATAATVAAASQVAPRATSIALGPSAAGTAVAGLPVAGETPPAAAGASVGDAPLGVVAAVPSAAAATGAQALERPPVQLAAPPAVVSAGETRRESPAAAEAAALAAGSSALEAVASENGVLSVSPRPTGRARTPHPPAPLAAETQRRSPSQIPRATFADASRAPASPGEQRSATETRVPLPPKPPAARSLSSGGAPEPTIYKRERRTARILAVLAGVLVVAVLAVVLVASVLGSGGKPASAGSAGTSQRGSVNASGHRPSISKAALRVVVLNATLTNGLAAKVADNLKSRGYGQAGALYGTPKGTYPVTMVQYASGHAPEAAGVASALNVPSSEVRPLQPGVAPLSGGAPVAVIVGEATANEGAGGARKSESNATEGEAGGETAGGETAGGGEAAGSQAAEAGA
jgi:LytR cell envelope-related transcriptional attenuator